MNCSVIPLNASIEPPLMPQGTDAFNARLQEMGVIVRAVRARMGIFIDSPGERCFLIDETGEGLHHETAFAALAGLQLRANPGMLVGPASPPASFALIAERFGGRLLPGKP